MKDNYNPIPKVYPTDLTECLKVFEKIRYKSYGFGMVFLDYSYTSKKWGFCFRNAANFTNPNIAEDEPIKAVHKMFDFLNSLIEERVSDAIPKDVKEHIQTLKK